MPNAVKWWWPRILYVVHGKVKGRNHSGQELEASSDFSVGAKDFISE